MSLILCVLVMGSLHGDEDTSKSVTVSSRLGQGFGKMIEIEGRLAETRERNFGNYKESIKVYWVNNKRLDPDPWSRIWELLGFPKRCEAITGEGRIFEVTSDGVQGPGVLRCLFGT